MIVLVFEMHRRMGLERSYLQAVQVSDDSTLGAFMVERGSCVPVRSYRSKRPPPFGRRHRP
jgi:hypothetical protein